MRPPTPHPPTPRPRPPLIVEPVEDLPDALPAAEQIPDVLPLAEVLPAPPRSRLRGALRPFGWIYVAFEWAVGVPCLLFGLAFLAAIPVLQFLSLGYLLEVSGRIARTARWRDNVPRGRGLLGFGLYLGQLAVRFAGCLIGARKAARVGFVVAGVWLLLLPLRLVSGAALSAQIIDPGGPVARTWKIGLTVLTVATAGFIVLGLYAMLLVGRALSSWWHGEPFVLFGRLRHGGFYTEARDGVWDFVASLHLPYYFWLGLRGFAGTLLWLVLPISLIALGRVIGQHGSQAAGPGFLVGLAGAVQLMFVLVQLPFLQARFAAENRFRALFEWHVVLRQFRRAPWAFGLAVVVTLLFALPLYLLKIEVVPREAAWLPGLVFIVFILPARMVSGWAYARSLRRGDRPRPWFVVATAPLWSLPVAAVYVLAVFLTQYTSWNGIWSLYEQHAFLLPVPFVGM
jgi:hypothetical protein